MHSKSVLWIFFLANEQAIGRLICLYVHFFAFFNHSVQELEAVEEQWHSETSELAALVSRLQEENRRISKQSDSPKHNDGNAANNELCKTDSSANLLNASDFQKMQRLRGQMEKQRDDLKCRDQEIEEKNNEIENVRVQCALSPYTIHRWIIKIF